MGDQEIELQPKHELSVAVVRKLLADNVPAPYSAAVSVDRQHRLDPETRQWNSITTVCVGIQGHDYNDKTRALTAETAFLDAVTRFKRFWGAKQRGTSPTKG